VGAGTMLLLENLRPHPAFVLSRTMDVLASNPAGLRLHVGMAEWPSDRRNFARYAVLHPDAATLLADRDEEIRACAGYLRALTVTHPETPGLARLVDELLLGSSEFACLWENYDVKVHGSGHRTFHHPDVGDLTLTLQTMRLEGTPGHRLINYFAEPGTPEHDAVVLLDVAAREQRSTRQAEVPAHDE
jgi:hypothetical protein